jgi:hypothetical protein
MTDQHLEALGDPDDADDADSDFASEHDDTAVDEDITDGRDRGEEESPRGWGGMDRDGPP